MIEIQVVANGWIVTLGRPVGDCMYQEERCYVFNEWGELVFHIKKELLLPERVVKRDGAPEQAG